VLERTSEIMDYDMVCDVVALMKDWRVKAVCIGGGGESLLNENTYHMIDLLSEAGIKSAVITNGTRLWNEINTLKKLSYLGISVDAATAETWNKIKGVEGNLFDKVIENISGIAGNGLEITYKYLLMPANHREIYAACKLAKSIGCDQFHFRPAGAPWFAPGGGYKFNDEIRASVSDQLDRARADFEDDKFRIYGVVSKFADDWSKALTFDRCWACYVTCFISPNGEVGLCCDRRGDDDIMLGTIRNIRELWGGEKHKAIHDAVDVRRCPRCTFSTVNEIFENVLLSEKMFCDFF
jgi:MoaA/NifB/PqqE/SkfB family radical SAM enzyme